MGSMLKKDDENGQLSCGIYSSPAVAGELYIFVKVESAITRLQLSELIAINGITFTQNKIFYIRSYVIC